VLLVTFITEHERERIVEGKTGEASPEEIVQSVEAILSRPATKRRHRRSHGRISFGDLARTIAESWKSVSPKARSIFEHYAERDSLRYKRELKVWKDRKDEELEASTLAKHSNFINSMNMSSSMRSEGSTTSEYLDSLPREGSYSQHSTSYNNPVRSFTSSFNSSIDSVSFNMSSAEPESIQQAFQRQQQILQEQLRRMDSNIEPSTNFAGINFSDRALVRDDGSMAAPGSNAFYASLPTARAIGGNGMEAVTRSGFGFAGFGYGGDTGMGVPGNVPSVDPDSFLGASSMQSGLGGIVPGVRHMGRSSDGQARGGPMGAGAGTTGSMTGHASFSGGFGHQRQLHQHDMMSPGIMDMMNQHQQSSDIDRMQQKIEWLQEQQRRLHMQQQQQLASTPQFMPMTNASNHSLQMDAMGSGHVISDRSQSDNNASYSTFASGVGVGGVSGMSPGRVVHRLPMQQLQHQPFLTGAGGDTITPTMVITSGSGLGCDPMNISTSNAIDRPSSDQQPLDPMNEFMANQGFLGGGTNTDDNGF
jgi:hypothetical protein